MILFVCFLFSMQLIAVGDSDTGMGTYFGMSVGNVDVDEFNNVATDDDDTGYSIYGGFDVNRYFGIELGYADLGEYNVGPFADNQFVNTEGSAVYVAAVGKYPFTDKFEFIGKLGYAFWDVESGIRDEDGSDFMYGLGAAFKINKNASIIADYTVYDINGDDAEVIAIGVKFNM